MGMNGNGEFFRRVVNSSSWRNAKGAMGRMLGHPVWWLIEKSSYNNLRAGREGVSYDMGRSSDRGARRCMRCFKDVKRVIKEIRGRNRAMYFKCHAGTRGLCLPLSLEGRTYGYICICHLKRPVEKEMEIILKGFLQSVCKEIKKELEVADLYESVRPRIVALSTIHTVHKLINSALNLDELLPRLARLVLQVLKARRCSIFMDGSKKGFLTNKVTVDLDSPKKVKRQKKVWFGHGLIGKMAETGTPVLRKNFLGAPMIDGEVIGAIVVTKNRNESPFTSLDREILTTFTEQAVVALKNARLYAEQQKLTIGAIKTIASVLDVTTDRGDTKQEIFINTAMAIARRMNLPAEEIKDLYYAALLHDAGCIGTPKRILKKTSKLTYREFEAIKEQPVKCLKLLQPLETIRPSLNAVLYHHERYDGTGYPYGFKQNKIPLGSRILAVADAFRAILCKRPYRRARTFSDAVAEIKKYGGTQFDPDVVRVFLQAVRNKEINRGTEKIISFD